MDRLSDYARTVVEEFRGKLNPDATRVERNWTAIERRALVAAETSDDPSLESDGEYDPPLAEAGAAPLGVTAGTLAVGAAASVAVAAIAGTLWWGSATSHQERPLSNEAAYQHERELGHHASAQECPPSSPAETTECPSEVEPMAVPAPSPVAEPEPPSRRTASKRRRAASRSEEPAQSADPASRLHEEIALVRRARAALRDGEAQQALRALEEHARRFEGGEFTEEATVLRITALCRDGRTAKGRALAEHFLESHGDSPLAGQAALACASPRTDRP